MYSKGYDKEADMSKKIAVFLADGFEEGEAVVPIDIARRAGIEVVMLSISDEIYVKGSHDILLKADALLSDTDLDQFDMIMLPGGMPGTANLEASEKVRVALTAAEKGGKYLAAICAAPRLLGSLGILNGKRATVYPGNEDYLKDAEYDREAKAVTDGRIITGRGMGCATEFGAHIVTALTDRETADTILSAIQYN